MGYLSPVPSLVGGARGWNLAQRWEPTLLWESLSPLSPASSSPGTFPGSLQRWEGDCFGHCQPLGKKSLVRQILFKIPVDVSSMSCWAPTAGTPSRLTATYIYFSLSNRL